jgi:acetate---CoA ligase (ADP-forming)
VIGSWTPARLEKLFTPRSVALVGASERSTWARLIVGGLERTGFTGRVELVNGRGGEVFGRSAVAQLTDLQEQVDAAYVMVSAPQVLPTIQSGCDAGIRNYVVLTSGFAEAGEDGSQAQQQIRRLALDNDLAIIGPNTMGFINVSDGVSLMPTTLQGPPKAGSVALVTQSGALAGATVYYCQAHRIGLSKVIALGNEAVIGVAEVIDYLIDDPETRAVAVMMEAIRSPAAFMQVAGRALEAGKGIVALKAGRTDAGARVGAAHTGAMVDDDRVVDAVFRQFGVIRVASLEALMTTAVLLTRTGKPLGGNRLGVVGISGGACNILADRAQDEGLRLEPFNPFTVKSLQALVSDYGAINNPLDVTGAAVNQPDLFANILGVVNNDPDIDVLLVQQDTPGGTSETLGRYKSLLQAAASNDRVPTLVVGSLGHPVVLNEEQFPPGHLDRALPGGMDRAIAAVGRAAWWADRRSRRRQRPAPAEPGPVPGHAPGEIWGEERSRPLLAAAGFPLVPAAAVASPEAALAAAEDHGYPVAVKGISPGVAHKSDMGGVELSVRDGDELVRALERIRKALTRAGHAPEGFLISPMRPPGLELIAGVARNSHWGPVVAVGFGGIWAEVLNDNALRLLPVDADDVRDMLRELRGAELLSRPRGLPRTDIGAVVEAVLALTRLAESLSSELESLEVNPLWVRGDQVEGFDALLTWGRPPAG